MAATDARSTLSSNNIPDTVRDAFKQELVARGFTIGPDGVAVKIELVQFYNDFKIGLFSGDAVASVAFNVKIVGRNGAAIFTNTIRAPAIIRIFSLPTAIMPASL